MLVVALWEVQLVSMVLQAAHGIWPEQQEAGGRWAHVQEQGGGASAGRVGYVRSEELIVWFLPGTTRLVVIKHVGDARGHS
jgi:hypothetical protein